MDKLTARDLQDIQLAQHAEAYIQQEQRKQSEQQQGGNSPSRRKHQQSYRSRIEAAKNKYVD